MAYEDRYKEFEQYIASGEPGVGERARNWSMAIGLQDVDRLKPSEFLLEQAKANIEGKIRWNGPLRQKDVSEEAKHQSEEAKRQNDVLETPSLFTERLSLKEMAEIRLIESDSRISIASITAKTGLSRCTVDRVISALKEKGILTREGAKNNATWIINPSKL